MPSPLHPIESLAHGVHVVDTGCFRPHSTASHLIVEAGRAAFVDVGTNHSLPQLLGALGALGLAPEAVDYVIVTHVHLDHAGGAGVLMQALPQARLVVHPRGARHMIDPGALMAGARAVYGEAEVRRTYGDLVPVPAERVIQTAEGMELALAGRPLRFLDTPGHARHHHCIWDERSRGLFTGDTFGLSYREFDTERGAWLLPTTPPSQVDPEALRASVRRLMGLQPECLYLTHYGRVSDVPRLGGLMLEQIDAMFELALRLRHAPERHEALKRGMAQIHLASLRAFGNPMDEAEVLRLLGLDIELNAQGIALWLDRDAPAG